jgi:hypothetical protein
MDSKPLFFKQLSLTRGKPLGATASDIEDKNGKLWRNSSALFRCGGGLHRTCERHRLPPGLKRMREVSSII